MVNQLRSEHLKEKKHATNWHEFHKLRRETFVIREISGRFFSMMSKDLLDALH